MIKALIAALTNKPSAKELAEQELRQAERELLREQTLLDYSTNIVRYQQDRIRRLKETLGHDEVPKRQPQRIFSAANPMGLEGVGDAA